MGTSGDRSSLMPAIGVKKCQTKSQSGITNKGTVINMMTIVYKIMDSLYINLTNQCNNRCDFCVRTKLDGVGTDGSLWLEREPEVQEVIDELIRRGYEHTSEVVFCGYGEPLIRADAVAETARFIKENSSVKVRINTNGQANLLWKRDITPTFSGLIDIISISLNAANAKKYDAVCHSEYGEAAYEAILDFAAKSKANIPQVVLTVVDVLPIEDIESCRKTADELGVEFRVRQQI